MIRLFFFVGAHPDFEAECSIHVFYHKGCVCERERGGGGRGLAQHPRSTAILANGNTPVEV